MPPADLAARLGPAPEQGVDPMTHTPTWVAAGIPANLLRQRPDIRSAERQVANQSALIGVAEADLYPAIAINGTLSWSAQELQNLFESKSILGNITPNFRWNILNYGRIVNNVRLQTFRTDELIAAYQNKVLTGAREVQTALRGFLRSQEQAESLARASAASGAATKIGLTQYKNGTIQFNTIFNLQIAEVQQQDQLAIAQGNIALNLINVYRALGGGWEMRAQREGCDVALVATPIPAAMGAPVTPPNVTMPGWLPEIKPPLGAIPMSQVETLAPLGTIPTSQQTFAALEAISAPQGEIAPVGTLPRSPTMELVPPIRKRD
jgi:hypothetical protein